MNKREPVYYCINGYPCVEWPDGVAPQRMFSWELTDLLKGIDAMQAGMAALS